MLPIHFLSGQSSKVVHHGLNGSEVSRWSAVKSLIQQSAKMTLIFWSVYVVLCFFAKLGLLAFGVQVYLPLFGPVLLNLLRFSVPTLLAALLIALFAPKFLRKIARIQSLVLPLGFFFLWISMMGKGDVFARIGSNFERTGLKSDMVSLILTCLLSFGPYIWFLMKQKKSNATTAFAGTALIVQITFMTLFGLIHWAGLPKSEKAAITLVIGSLCVFFYFLIIKGFDWIRRYQSRSAFASLLITGVYAGILILGLSHHRVSAVWAKRPLNEAAKSISMFGKKAVKLRIPNSLKSETCELWDPKKSLVHRVQEGDNLYFFYSASPLVSSSSDQFQFLVTGTLKDGSKIDLFRKTLIPSQRSMDSGWQEAVVPLKSLVGKDISIQFKSSILSDSMQRASTTDPGLWGGVRCGNFLRKPSEMNVIFLSLDTLRGDRLGVSGYFRDTTPHIDKLARAGVYFSEAISQAPWTSPSHMSLMTGLYPSFHGVMDPPGTDQKELGESIQTIAEVLREQGYRTQAFTGSGAVAANYGFYQGFDNYAETYDRLPSDIDFVFNEAFNWLGKNKGDKFFLFIHTYEVHAPFTHPYFSEQNPGEKSEAEQVNDLYDGDIRFADGYVGRLMEKLVQLKLTENTILVVFSDHGEDLYGRFMMEHGHTLYDELIHIPLIFYSPKLLSPRMVPRFQAQLVDIKPTVLDLLGLPSKGLQGASLKPILKGGEIPNESYAISEAIAYGPEQKSIRYVGDGKGKFIFTPKIPRIQIAFPPVDSKLMEDPLFAHQSAPWVNLARSCGGSEFFDLQADPNEKDNRAAFSTPLFIRLKQRMDKFLSEAALNGKKSGSSAVIDSDLKEKLKSLGYL